MTSSAEWNTAAMQARGPVSVLDRIIAILDSVRSSGDSISVTEIALQTSMPKSTVSRLVTDLVAQRYLQRTEKGVTLGLRLFELGARTTLPRRLVPAAASVMKDLSERTGERVALWVQQGTDMVSLAAMAGRLPMLPVRSGMHSPVLTTASGKAYLAFCPDRRVLDRVSAPLGGIAAARLRTELDRVRSSVVATDRGAAYPGVLAVASPILSQRGTVLGAISVAGPIDQMDPGEVAPLVRAAGLSLTTRLDGV